MTIPGYEAALEYVARRARELSREVLKKDLPIDAITMYTHDDAERNFLRAVTQRYGLFSPELSQGATLHVVTNREIGGDIVRLLGVRDPGLMRVERGYGDYPVSATYFEEVRVSNNPYITEVRDDDGTPLLEVVHSAFDVRGFLIQRKV